MTEPPEDIDDQFHDAIRAGDEARVSALLPRWRRECGTDQEAIRLACDLNPAMVPVLARLVPVDTRDDVGGTILMHAAANDKIDAVRRLLDQGADVNAANDENETPFSYACAYDHLEIATLLHERGADINVVHRRGGTPMDDLTQSPRIMAFLASIGAKTERELGSSRPGG